MSARYVPPEKHLNYQITFTLQRSIGEAFSAQCALENVSKQERLRYLVNEYMGYVSDVKDQVTIEPRKLHGIIPCRAPELRERIEKGD